MEKKSEVSKNAKSLFEGLKLICSGFSDNIFGKHPIENRSGGEEKCFKLYSDDDDDDDDDNDDDHDNDDEDDDHDDDDDDDDDKLYTPKDVTHLMNAI